MRPALRAADAAAGWVSLTWPRLELVRLLDRADDVLASQVRLRGLSRANALVAVELSLPVVLRQIVGAPGTLSEGRTEVEVAGTFGPDRMAAVRIC
jgi:hypothetical protein